MTQSDVGELYIVNTACNVYRSVDGGDVWTRQNSTPVCNGPTSITTDRYGYVYVVDDSDRVFQSQDHGENWSNRGASGLGGIPIDMTSDDNSYLFIVNDSRRVFRSVDGGSTWTTQVVSCCGGVPSGIASEKDGDLYISNEDGQLFRSVDDGGTWAGPAFCSTSLTVDLASGFSDAIYLLEQDMRVFKSTAFGEICENLGSSGGGVGLSIAADPGFASLPTPTATPAAAPMEMVLLGLSPTPTPTASATPTLTSTPASMNTLPSALDPGGTESSAAARGWWQAFMLGSPGDWIIWLGPGG
jgi:hypothetical protein